MTRGRIIAAVVALVVIAAIVIGIMASAASRTPQVSVAEVQKQDLTQTVTASGQIEGDVKADVFAPTAQATLTIKSILVADGQKVKAGQVLATLDPAPLDLAVAQARSGLRQAEAQASQNPNANDRLAAGESVDASRLNLETQKENLDAARTALDNTERNRDVAWQQYLTVKGVFGSTSPTTTQALQAYNGLVVAVEQAEAAVAGANTAYEQAEAGVYQAKSARQKANSTAGSRSADAAVEAARQALRQAESNRDKANLTAPIDGVVVFAGGGGGGSSAAAAAGGSAAAALAGAGGGQTPAVGGTVSPGSAPFTIFQLNAVNFNAQVDEADISNVAVGMKATVTLDAFPGVTFDSTVVQVKTQAIQTSTGGTAFPVLLALKNTGKRLLVGMGGNADIQVSGIKDAVVVPVEALFDESGGTYVYVVDNSNVVHRRKVKTGITTDTQAQILEGVQPGEKVALGGLSNLKDGMTVRVK